MVSDSVPTVDNCVYQEQQDVLNCSTAVHYAVGNHVSSTCTSLRKYTLSVSTLSWCDLREHHLRYSMGSAIHFPMPSVTLS